MYRILTPGKSAPAPTVSQQAEALMLQGWTCQQGQEVEAALRLYREAQMILEAEDAREHWQLLVPLKNNLATLLRSRGRFREAEAAYIQAINLMEACHPGPPGLDLAELFANLAALYSTAALPEAAIRMQERVVRILESVAAPQHEQALRKLGQFHDEAQAGQNPAHKSSLGSPGTVRS